MQVKLLSCYRYFDFGEYFTYAEELMVEYDIVKIKKHN